jgi:hypothetical protein
VAWGLRINDIFLKSTYIGGSWPKGINERILSGNFLNVLLDYHLDARPEKEKMKGF